MSDHFWFWYLSLGDSSNNCTHSTFRPPVSRVDHSRLARLVRDARFVNAELKRLQTDFDHENLVCTNLESWVSMADTASTVTDYLAEEVYKDVKRASKLKRPGPSRVRQGKESELIEL